MKRLLIILIFTLLWGQEGLWQPGTAFTLPEGSWELGVFQPLRWGYKEGVELSFYKLTTLIMPNISVKKSWLKTENRVISSLHSVYYPTPLLNKLQSPLEMDIGEPNMFALISPEFDIQNMIILNNTILFSQIMNKETIITGKAGVSLAMGADELAEESSIDLPLVYHRLSVLYNGWALRCGLDINRQLHPNVSYLMDGDFFLIPGQKGNIAFEHKLLVSWHKSPRFVISAGYKFVYGLYPDGYPDEHIARLHLLPLIDLQWAKD